MNRPPIHEASSIWIIGMSAAGKSTLAGLLVERLRAHDYPCILIDGDEIRRIFGKSLGYDPESRRRQTERVLALAGWISRQGILPVVAIIHPFEDDRLRCRETLPGYFEIFLKCSLDVCVDRDAKNVYGPVLSGTAHNVVGVDIPFDPPGHADLVLESDRTSPQDMLDAAWEALREPVLREFPLRLVREGAA